MNEDQREVVATVPPSPGAAGGLRRRTRSLRAALGWLLTAVLLPLSAAGAAFLVHEWGQQRDAAVAQLVEQARTLRRAVDRELSLDLAVLGGLAASREIDRGEWRAFHELAATAATVRPGSWIALYEPGGQNVVNTRIPFGQTLPNLREIRATRADADWGGRKVPLLDLVCLFGPLEGGKPCFSGLVYGVVTQRPAVGTIVPVVRGGKPVYVLALVYSSRFFEDLMVAERAPGVIAGMWDQRGLFIARSRDSEKFVGLPGPEPFTRGVAPLPQESVGETLNVESVPLVYAYSRSTVTDYVVAAGLPKAAVLAPAWRALWLWLAVVLSAGIIGFLLAFRLWQRLAIPLTALARQARSPGEHTPLAASGIDEVDALRHAIQEAERSHEIRWKMEREREEAQRRLAAIVESTEDAIISKDLEGKITTWNPGAERLFGYAASEIVGKNVSLLLPPDRASEEADILARIRSGERVEHYETRRLRKDGTVIEVSVAVSTLRDAAGHLVGASKIARDITDQKRAEEALRAANERLRDADKRKDEFLGMLSHELRNPLAPIRNSVYVLRHSDPSSPQADRARTVIERQSEHLTRIVDDLLDVTRIARGKILLHRDRVDLRGLVARAAEDVHHAADDRGVNLRVALTESRLWADADATRITQVLGNLLNNAIKFTPRGGEIAVTLREVDATGEISVRDTGVGIDPELLPTMFEAFVQGKRTLARTEGGVGLGLALVKGLVELHGGSVEAHSEGVGKGAEFIVRLPLIGPLVTEHTFREAPTRATTARRVLVVDDNADAAESLAELVSLFGHTVEIAYDGPSAIEKVRARRPDVVLCDLGLPGMTGYEVAQALRAEHDTALRLVAVSGYAHSEDVARATAAGFDDHVAKPPDPEKIERLLS